jgi:uncharacterized protein
MDNSGHTAGRTVQPSPVTGSGGRCVGACRQHSEEIHKSSDGKDCIVKKFIVLVNLLGLVLCGISAGGVRASDNVTTALINAARNRDSNTVHELLTQGANPNATDESGMSPLMFAAMNGDTGMVTFLADHGADISAKDAGGNSALLAACVMGRSDVARFLLGKGADVNQSNSIGTTPLMAACLYNKIEVAKLLLDNGAQIAVKNKEGMTPLTMASKGSSGNLELVAFLKAHGAKE